ncbi:hypothetical protein [Methylorubrum podarium]|jgi:hypothetical protein|uniref:hypothetical protein n=1 Tax=Methylorubrum podarium TaxID=200476 RepID=UPI001EE25047|nr:hypothetical protein [Methylorubrum podarium]
MSSGTLSGDDGADSIGIGSALCTIHGGDGNDTIAMRPFRRLAIGMLRSTNRSRHSPAE